MTRSINYLGDNQVLTFCVKETASFSARCS